MSHADILDIDRGHIFRKHLTKKLCFILKNRPLLRFLHAGCYGAHIYCEILSVHVRYSFACKRLGAYGVEHCIRPTARLSGEGVECTRFVLLQAFKK